MPEADDEQQQPTPAATEPTPVQTQATEPQAPAPEQPTETAEETPAEPRTYTDWREALKDADLDELLKDDRVAGKLGQVADKRARELQRQAEEKAATERAAEAARLEEERLKTLRRTNPNAYATEMERKDATAEAIAAEAARARSLATDVTGRLQQYVTDTFPREVVESFAGKTYDGDYAQGIVQYIDDLNKAHRDQVRTQLESELKPAIRKQVLAELNGGEAPEPATRGSKGGRSFNTEVEMATAFSTGEITADEMRAWYRGRR